MSKKILFILLLFSSLLANSQEVFVNVDFVNVQIWRGMRIRGASIQPKLGGSLGGFTLYAWGSSEFSTGSTELDIYLEYEYKRLKLVFADYYTQNENNTFKYFSYQSHLTEHCWDAGIEYTIAERFPLRASWYTIVAGNDFKSNGERAWSSYIELSYPFKVKNVEMGVELGITPWEGMYANKFNVNNIAISASKKIQITDKFSFPIFGKFGVNPYEDKAYFVIGIGF